MSATPLSAAAAAATATATHLAATAAALVRPLAVAIIALTGVLAARALYGAAHAYWRQRRAPRAPSMPAALRRRRTASVSEIAVEGETSLEARVRCVSRLVGAGLESLKVFLWDSFLYPLLAWVINTMAVVFALVFSFVPAMVWVRRKNLRICVATSLSATSSSSSSSSSAAAAAAAAPSSRLRHIEHAQATELNKGKPTPTLSPYFSALMVPAALSCTRSRKSLVLDLDETLVHSQLKLTEHCDLRLEVRVDEFPTVFYVSKRPYLDVFLRTVAQWYDIVIYTASLQKYGDPLITVLDTDRVVKRRIFRQDCIKRNGNFVKDLTIVNPNLSDVLIVDNSPAAYSIQPSNAVPIEAWYQDQNDEELLNLLPLLHAIAFLNDVRSLLDLRLTGGALAGRRGRPVTR